ncbi:hypothetical protein [Deinococcus misasensis]|nr:hypothetical protein [Deinococcus misasensis]
MNLSSPLLDSQALGMWVGVVVLFLVVFLMLIGWQAWRNRKKDRDDG